MNTILPEQPAKEHCLALMASLDASDLGKTLCQDGHGRMFGVLVCQDGTVYKAFSGLLEGSYIAQGFVPPVFNVERFIDTVDRYGILMKSSPDTKTLSRQCWEELKGQYQLHCFDGKVRTLAEIFPQAPTGTGDCCAPRLFSHAYSQGKEPLSLCEFFYGSGSFEHKSFQGPCDSRCKPILPAIVGLDIVYQDPDIVVVNKPGGILSIEGRGPEKQDCIASRVRRLFPSSIQQPCIHRLDQATSGLQVLGLTKRAHYALALDFEQRRVHKEYEALVEGLVLDEGGNLKESGTIDLPIRLDTDNRPHQIVDMEKGKSAITIWRRLGIENRFGGKVTRLNLVPHTGRTHQLRVHCAYGLGHPIIGDALYGRAPHGEISRLMLQAKVLEFTHPCTGQRMRFELESEF